MDTVYETALKIGAKAIETARRYGTDATFVAVDRGGHPVVVLRQDLSGYPTVETARRKAATAACLGLPSHLVAGAANGDPIMARALDASPDMLGVPGGFPLVIDGIRVGGLGLAGGAYHEDQMIMEKALEAFAESVRDTPEQ